MNSSPLARVTVLSILLAAGLIALPVHAAAPIVENVVVAQRTDGSQLVDITYDVTDADNDSLAIGVSISNDAGQTWQIHISDLTGDVGLGIAPGPGKAIIWNAGTDLANFDTNQLAVRIAASDVGVLGTSHSPGNYWIMDWPEADWSDDALVEKIAKGDVAVISLYTLWDNQVNEGLDVIGRLKAVNPDLVVLGYFLSKTNIIWWENNAPGSFTRTLFESTKPFWSYTTTGDTLMNWPNQVVLNVLEPACRDSIVMTLAEFQNSTANPVDGILWDYFDRQIWIAPNVAETVDGQPDLNGNGIAMSNDQAEQVAYLAANDSLVLRTREIMGDSFIQVFNGTRAHRDPEFAALGDGMYYEIFPTQVFPDPDMATALDPNYEYSLFNATSWPRTDNGGPYIVLGMYWISRYIDYNREVVDISFGDMYRAVGLLTDVYSTWIPNGHDYHWPQVEINLGPPLGPTVIDGVNYSRDFLYGRVELTMKTGKYPNPFSYKITVGDRIVEELNIPYHHP